MKTILNMLLILALDMGLSKAPYRLSSDSMLVAPLTVPSLI